jgi:hypothetical protein
LGNIGGGFIDNGQLSLHELHLTFKQKKKFIHIVIIVSRIGVTAIKGSISA